MNISEHPSDAIIIACILVGFDFSAGGIEIIPDTLGWILIALAASALARALRPGRSAALGALRGLAWVAALGSGVILALSILAAAGVLLHLPRTPLLTLFLAIEPVSAATIAVLARFLELRTRAWAGRASTTTLLRAGWITGAGAALVGGVLGALVLASVLGTPVHLPAAHLLAGLVRIAGIASVVLTGIGLVRAREDGAIV